MRHEIQRLNKKQQADRHGHVAHEANILHLGHVVHFATSLLLSQSKKAAMDPPHPL